MHGHSPDPGTAYAQWTDACARAGWHGAAPGPGEPVAIADALGRVSAAPVVARYPSPRAACAAMDGIAINAEESNTHTQRRWTLAPGTFTWVDTGDTLPPGRDTVIKREHVTIDADGVASVDDAAHVSPGHHVRGQGEDFAAGQVLVPGGRRLRPADLAVAAAAGYATLTVTRKPAVAIIPTGDEIRATGMAECLRPGEIIDSNSVYLAARCARAGAAATVSAVVPDDPDKLAAELRRAAAGADLVLIIAGSSRGRDDHTAAVLAQVGGVTVAGIAVRPGHPGLLGYAKTPSDTTVPVIGLPGYPVAAAVVFELFAAPLLARLEGAAFDRPTGQARLAGEWAGARDVTEWVPVHVSPDGAATPTGHGAGATSHLARANAWWVIPAGAAPLPAGAQITVIPWQ
ncbi:MAG TPA: molybdopterin molybdotransferase MoeA [Trebonia sp.]|jgi:putative molybdopterin biosynthesis protein|nr:molybdopterin molybdotransferase MoeA [Trebonia sp.]